MKTSLILAVTFGAALLAPLRQAAAQPADPEPASLPEPVAVPDPYAAPALLDPKAARGLATERLLLQLRNPDFSELTERRLIAQRQKTTGKWLLGVGIANLAAGMAVASPELAFIAGCNRSPCFYDSLPLMMPTGLPFAIIGAALTIAGAPLYAVGSRTLKSLPPASGGAVSVTRTITDADALASLRLKMQHHRLQTIIAGAIFGFGAALAVGAGVGAAFERDFHYVPTEAAVAAIGATTAVTAFGFLVGYGNKYRTERAILSGVSTASVPSVSLQPVLSSNHYGLSFSGSF